MKKNMASFDQVFRIVLALVCVVLVLTHVVIGTLSIALIVAAAILLITGFTGFCPIFRIFGLNFNKPKK
jgi:hypothetical protein